VESPYEQVEGSDMFRL